MKRLILGLLVLALVGAGATVLLVDRYIDRRMQSTEKEVDDFKSSKVVLVAKNNIPIGKKIQKSDLAWIAWPDKGVQGNFVAARKPDNKLAVKMVGAIARRGIIKGTPMTEGAIFRSTKPGFLAGALDPNMRAVSISVTAESGAAGFIMPGDRVDVILMQKVPKNTAGKSPTGQEDFRPFLNHTAETFLRNIRVLAVDQKVDDFEKKAKVSKTVTVEVTPKQAETLVVAKAMGKMSLALRSLQDERPVAASDTNTVLETPPGAVAGGALEGVAKTVSDDGPTVTTDLEVSPVLAATVATASGPISVQKPKGKTKSSPRRSQIKIYRGGQPSTVNF